MAPGRPGLPLHPRPWWPCFHPTGLAAWVRLSLLFPASWSEEGPARGNECGWLPHWGPDVTLTLSLSLVPQNNEKLQESPCIFALTPRQVELIRNSRCAVPRTTAGLHGRRWTGVVLGHLEGRARAAFSSPDVDAVLHSGGKGSPPSPVLGTCRVYRAVRPVCVLSVPLICSPQRWAGVPPLTGLPSALLILGPGHFLEGGALDTGGG